MDKLKKQRLFYLSGLMVFLALLTTFTFLDLQFSKAIFNIDSIFGKIFESFGEVPAILIASFCGLMLLKTRTKDKKWKNIVGFIGYGWLFVSFVFMGAFMPVNYLKIHIAWVFPIAVLFGVGLYFLGKLVDVSDRKKVIRIALIGLLTFVCAIVIVSLLKMCWNRPRFRDMSAVGNFEEFRIWLIPAVKGNLILDTFGKGQAYASFPSGHVANSSVMIWLILLPAIMPKVKKAGYIFGIVIAVWITLVAVSRIVVGAHFATDTLVGFAITATSFFVLKKLFKININENKTAVI